MRSIAMIIMYISAITIANFGVYYFGSPALIFSSFFLIPFDFVVRCYFHERWKGSGLAFKLLPLIISGSLITYLINHDALNIALGSSSGFISSQIIAGLFYQVMIDRKRFIKINGSDAVGIIADSFVFQMIAFGFIDAVIIISQIVMKLSGGLLWYWILVVKLDILKMNKN